MAGTHRTKTKKSQINNETARSKTNSPMPTDKKTTKYTQTWIETVKPQ